MSHPDARQMRLAAHVLKRRSIARDLGVAPKDLRFVEAPGAPRLAPPHDHLFVSLSHASGAVAVAVSERAVGIDVEIVRRDRDWRRLAARRLASGEADALGCEENPAHAFTLLWCAKEALMKALGLTLGHALKLDCTGLSRTPTSRHGAALRAWMPAPGFCCALAEKL